MTYASEVPVSALSVILPVYNGQEYLAEAIDSVLSQSYRDFELIIIDDGSSDGSAAIIEKLSDPRVRSFRQSNNGLPATLNRGISLARGKYIARQDQDDVCLRLRFEKQVNYLDGNPNVGMVGAGAEIWVGNERTSRLLQHPKNNESLKFGLLFDNHFVHSSIMIRRSVFENVGGYAEDASRQPPEDYELWSRVMRKYQLSNLPEVLMAYREVEGSMSRTGVNPFLPNLIKISAENISWASGYAADVPDVVALARLSRGVYDHIPDGVSVAGMRSVLDRAAERIAQEAGCDASRLDAVTGAHIRKIRYHYLNYRCGGLIGKILNGRMGSFAKRLLKRVM